MLYDNRTWIDDIDEIINSLPFLHELEDKTVMITGAAGLICSAIVDIFIRYNERYKKKIHIFAAGRWASEMQDRFGVFVEKDYYTFISFDASKMDNCLLTPCDYVIHGASNAYPSLICNEPVETMLSNIFGMKSLLDYAKDYSAKRVLFISSSEVYGQKADNQPYHEHEYGYIDLLNSRNSYAVGKRAAETLCASYMAEYGVESVIVRPGHIYGPTASKKDNRVASSWAYCASHGEDIIMKSDGKQLRSYCYCLDCASAILTVLLRGENGKAYNVSNPNSIVSVKSIAEALTQLSSSKLVLQQASEEEKKVFNPMINSSLDSKRLEALGWRGLFDIKRGLAHTVSILKEVK